MSNIPRVRDCKVEGESPSSHRKHESDFRSDFRAHRLRFLRENQQVSGLEIRSPSIRVCVLMNCDSNRRHSTFSRRVEEDSAVLRDPTVTSSWTGTGDLRPRSKNDDKILRILAIVATLLYVVGIVSSIVTAQVRSQRRQVP